MFKLNNICANLGFLYLLNVLHSGPELRLSGKCKLSTVLKKKMAIYCRNGGMKEVE